jgi:hypothetical protein
VIYADDGGRAGAEICYQPFRYLAARPIPPGTFWGSYLVRRREPVTLIDAQTLEAGCRRLSARVINADVAIKDHRSVKFASCSEVSLDEIGLYHPGMTFYQLM